MKAKEIFKVILEYLLKTSFKRYLNYLAFLGVALLGLSWPDVINIIFGKTINPQNSEKYASFGQWVGLGMISVSFIGHLVMLLFSKIADKKARTDMLKQNYAHLAAHLDILIEGFKDPNINRGPSYYNVEIENCEKAAIKILESSPPLNIASNRVLVALTSPKIDASKIKPYFDLTTHDLIELNSLMREQL